MLVDTKKSISIFFYLKKDIRRVKVMVINKSYFERISHMHVDILRYRARISVQMNHLMKIHKKQKWKRNL